VLVIAGKNDLYDGLAHGKRIHESIPGSKLEILPTGHASAIEAPDLFNRVVQDFLAQVNQ